MQQDKLNHVAFVGSLSLSLFALQEEVETSNRGCTQKRAKVWYSCTLGSWVMCMPESTIETFFPAYNSSWKESFLSFTVQLITMCIFQFISMLNIYHHYGCHFKGQQEPAFWDSQPACFCLTCTVEWFGVFLCFWKKLSIVAIEEHIIKASCVVSGIC
jgi:hypothetical protein